MLWVGPRALHVLGKTVEHSPSWESSSHTDLTNLWVIVALHGLPQPALMHLGRARWVISPADFLCCYTHRVEAWKAMTSVSIQVSHADYGLIYRSDLDILPASYCKDCDQKWCSPSLLPPSPRSLCWSGNYLWESVLLFHNISLGYQVQGPWCTESSP